MGIISSQLFHLPDGGSEKWALFVLSLGWQMEIPISISRSHENRRDAPRIVENPREALRSPEKPREAMRKRKKTREASRGLEKNRGDPRKLYWRLLRTLWISRRFVISFTVRMFASRASEKYGLDVKERNRSKTRSFFHVIRLYCYPNSFSNISDLSSIGYNIHLHYMIFCFILNIEKWLCRIAL